MQPCFLWKWLAKGYYWAADLLYHPFAWAYDWVAWLVSFGYWSQWRKDSLACLVAGVILETGVGTGSLLIEMAERGLDVTGLEPSTQMHRVTGRKLARKRITVKRVQGITQTIPFPKGTFANVLSTFPTDYVVDPETLREIHRVLESKGRWVMVGLGVRFNARWKQKLGGWLLGNWKNARMQAYIQKLRSAGFSVEIIEHETHAYLLPILIAERCDG